MINWKELKINYSTIGSRFEVSPEAVGMAPLIRRALESPDAAPVSHLYQEGYSDKAFEIMLKKIVDLKGKKIYENFTAITEEHFYVWDNAFVEVSYSRSKLMTIHAVSADETITAACKEVAKMFATPAKKGYVFAITRGHQGLQLTRIGYAGCKVEKNNYTDAVGSDYDYVIEDLNSKDPTGRIVILDGPPGTGKTHLIRGVLMDVPKAMFIIVPPNMISSIGGPELIPLLLRTKEDYGKKGPIILVLEDADQCLAPRQSDNISSISSILNLGDGIFGSLFDVRIIATTNGKAKDLDEGIVRDMRLSKRISIGTVPYENANQIYKRILKDQAVEMPKPAITDRNMMKPMNEKRSYSLAEIYKLARNNGWKPAPAEEEPKISHFEEEFDEDYV